MSRGSRRRGRVAVGAILGVALALAAGTIAWVRHGDDAAPPRHPDARLDDLRELRTRLIPVAGGGWTAVTPAPDPWIEGWLLSAAQQPPPAPAFDRALAAADVRFRARGDDERSVGLALAESLPGPASDPDRADQLAADVLARATSAIEAGDSAWLAVVLQLSAGPSASADAASRWLAGRAGAVGCDRLDLGGAPLPDPSTTLTVALRVLASQGARCRQATAVLDAVLEHPRWDTWIAAPEVADLAEVSGTLPRATRSGLAARFDGFLAVGPERPIDLGAIALVQRSRRRLDLPTDLDPLLVHHLEGQVIHRGGLAGRSTAAPTAFDVAVLRQLVGEGLVARGLLDQTVAAVMPTASREAGDSVVDRLLADDAPLRCASAPAKAPERPRVSFDGLVADDAWSMTRAACRGDVDVAATVARLHRSAHADVRPVRIAATELAACRRDPSLLDDVPGLRLRAQGPFASDSLLVWARAVAADPVAACRAHERA